MSACSVVAGEQSTGPKSETDAAALLDVRAVASLLMCSVRTVYRLADAGRMPRPVKLGALVRWSSTAISNWIDTGCRPMRNTKGGQP